MKVIDLKGQRFGRLTVMSLWPVRDKNRHALWGCKCDCGTIIVRSSNQLRTGKTQSCGCLQKSRTSMANTKHGMCGTPEYRSWRAMLTRCYNPNRGDFKHYGGRGIKVCKRWMEFKNFLADMGTRPGGTTLDRIDNNRSYKPSNCRWTTWDKQANNRRKRTRRV